MEPSCYLAAMYFQLYEQMFLALVLLSLVVHHSTTFMGSSVTQLRILLSCHIYIIDSRVLKKYEGEVISSSMIVVLSFMKSLLC